MQKNLKRKRYDTKVKSNHVAISNTSSELYVQIQVRTKAWDIIKTVSRWYVEGVLTEMLEAMSRRGRDMGKVMKRIHTQEWRWINQGLGRMVLSRRRINKREGRGCHIVMEENVPKN